MLKNVMRKALERKSIKEKQNESEDSFAEEEQQSRYQSQKYLKKGQIQIVTKKSQVKSKNQEQFEKILVEKNSKIVELEQRLDDVRNQLFHFIEELKSTIRQDSAHDQELKEILLGHDRKLIELGYKSEYLADIPSLLSLIKNITKDAFDFRKECIGIEERLVRTRIEINSSKNQQEDLILLYQQLEKNLKLAEKQVKSEQFLIKVAKQKLDQLGKQNLELIEKASTIFDGFKQDNSKLLQILKEKDEDITSLQKDIESKKAMIKDRDERLMGILVLERKLKELKEQYDKDIMRTENHHAKEICELKDVRRVHPSLFVWNEEIKSNMQRLEESTAIANTSKTKAKQHFADREVQFRVIIQGKEKEIAELKHKLILANNDVTKLKREKNILEKVKQMIERKSNVVEKILGRKMQEAYVFEDDFSSSQM